MTALKHRVCHQTVVYLFEELKEEAVMIIIFIKWTIEIKIQDGLQKNCRKPLISDIVFHLYEQNLKELEFSFLKITKIGE